MYTNLLAPLKAAPLANVHAGLIAGVRATVPNYQLPRVLERNQVPTQERHVALAKRFRRPRQRALNRVRDVETELLPGIPGRIEEVLRVVCPCWVRQPELSAEPLGRACDDRLPSGAKRRWAGVGEEGSYLGREEGVEKFGPRHLEPHAVTQPLLEFEVVFGPATSSRL